MKDKVLLCEEAYLRLGKYIDMESFLKDHMGLSTKTFCKKIVGNDNQDLNSEEIATFANALKDLSEKIASEANKLF